MRQFLVSVVVCVLALPLAASEPKILVHVWIDQLGSESYEEREAATKELERIGPAAIPALAIAVCSENQEVARRAKRLLDRLRPRDSSSRLLRPRLITVSYRNTPLLFALADLKARTGLPLEFPMIQDPLRLITCETGEVPVWEALDLFCRDASLRELIQPELETLHTGAQNRTYAFPPAFLTAETTPIVLVEGASPRLPGSRQSSVRVQILPASFPGHRVWLGTGEVELCLDVTPAPGLHWQDSPTVRITRVQDDAEREGGAGTPRIEQLDPVFTHFGPRINRRNGLAFRPDFSNGTTAPHRQPNPRIVRVPLKLATPSASSLKRLEGVVVGTVLVPSQTLIGITDLEQNLNRTFEGPDGFRVTVLSIERVGDFVQLRVQSDSRVLWNGRTNNGGIAWPEAPRNEASSNQWHARNAAGQTVPLTGRFLLDLRSNEETQTVVHQLTFSHSSGMPHSLHVVGPKREVVEVPFRFENVPLP